MYKRFSFSCSRALRRSSFRFFKGIKILSSHSKVIFSSLYIVLPTLDSFSISVSLVVGRLLASSTILSFRIIIFLESLTSNVNGLSNLAVSFKEIGTFLGFNFNVSSIFS